MALSILTDIEGVSADLLSANLVDLTVYGGANPARNTLALYLYLYKRDALMNDTLLTVSNSDPLNVTSWSFSLAGDGLYRAILFAFPIWSAGSYVLNNCVYRNGAYYIANTSTTGVPGISPDWTLITDIIGTVLNISPSLVTIGQTNNFTTANAEAGPLGDKLQDTGPTIKAGKCQNINAAVNVMYGEVLIDSAWMNFERGDYTQAQELIDYVNANWS